MNLVTSLNASALVFDLYGKSNTASFARRMASDCSAMSDELGPDAAHSLFRHWTTQLAEIAAATATQSNFHKGAERGHETRSGI